MPRLLPLLWACLLAACGMKGDLVLPQATGTPARQGDAAPGSEPAQPPVTSAEEDIKRQGVNPPSADPDVSAP